MKGLKETRFNPPSGVASPSRWLHSLAEKDSKQVGGTPLCENEQLVNMDQWETHFSNLIGVKG